MPDKALESTERQFAKLLDGAAEGIAVRLSPYALAEVPRSAVGLRRVKNSYSAIEDLWDSRLDGLIVTGTEPRAPSLTDEPYWHSLTRVLDWADQNTSSTILSCLSAHAALLYFDGINRCRLSDKRFGVFEYARASDHPLIAGAQARFRMPHSRWNDIPEDELDAAGYRILSHSKDAGVDSFVKQRRSLFLYFQGHPEYEADTLFLEYRRDVGRFLRGERDTYPTMPRDYFDARTADRASAFQERALHDRREELLAQFPVARVEPTHESSWHATAVRMYRNWLEFLCARKENRLKVSAPVMARSRGLAL
jgi:homoserine O-succinyltransferase